MTNKARIIKYFKANYISEPQKWIMKGDFESAIEKAKVEGQTGFVETCLRELRYLVEDRYIIQNEFVPIHGKKKVAFYRYNPDMDYFSDIEAKPLNSLADVKKLHTGQFQASGGVSDKLYVQGLPIEVYSFFEGN